MAKTEKTGTVQVFWTDLKDNNRPYELGDTFPHPEAGYEVTDARMEELASENNKRKQRLIIIDETTEKTESVDQYADLTVSELKDLAKEKGLEGYSKLNREDLVALLEK